MTMAPDHHEAEFEAFPPSRAAALHRLAEFVPQAGRAYAANRNHDLPGHPHVSGLSSYIRHRALSEAEVAAAVLDRFALSTAEKFLQEVLWRSYFKGWLERRPGIWDRYLRGLAAARDRLTTEGGLRRSWEDACAGTTGIAPFDHWAEELVRTGYLHNHARMWFASIWTHTLRLPWELGADFFMRHLLCGDPASNTLSWRWVVGLHTRGKVYRARASNIAKFTDGAWDAGPLGHQLARADQVEPIDDPEPPSPGPVPEDADWDRGARTGLLLHEDELHPAHLTARGLEPAAVAVLIAPAGRSPLVPSRGVRAFTTALAEDAAERWGGGPVTEDPEAILAWASSERLEQVVIPYAPVGPVRSALDLLEPRWGVPVTRPLRDWDAAAWPHATAGFFRVKTKMTDILATIPSEIGR